MRVFRDKTGLAVTPELWGSIQKALEDADYFILLASPRAAQSTWVEQEVDWWLRNRSPTHLLIVWTDGALTWDTAVGDFDWVNTTALPRRLEKVFQEEPNYLDLRFAKTSTDLSLRQPKFLEAIAGLSATLQGRSLDELIGEDLGQHQENDALAAFCRGWARDADDRSGVLRVRGPASVVHGGQSDGRYRGCGQPATTGSDVPRSGEPVAGGARDPIGNWPSC